jgi:NADH-quinone oxidoreductase subunit N
VAKVFVFAAAVDAKQYALAIVGVLNSIIGLYYYLTVLKVAYLYRSEDDEKPAPVPSSMYLALGILVIGIIVVGSFFAPWFTWSVSAALGMF